MTNFNFKSRQIRRKSFQLFVFYSPKKKASRKTHSTWNGLREKTKKSPFVVARHLQSNFEKARKEIRSTNAFELLLLHLVTRGWNWILTVWFTSTQPQRFCPNLFPPFHVFLRCQIFCCLELCSIASSREQKKRKRLKNMQLHLTCFFHCLLLLFS